MLDADRFVSEPFCWFFTLKLQSTPTFISGFFGWFFLKTKILIKTNLWPQLEGEQSWGFKSKSIWIDFCQIICKSEIFNFNHNFKFKLKFHSYNHLGVDFSPQDSQTVVGVPWLPIGQWSWSSAPQCGWFSHSPSSSQRSYQPA